MNYWGAKGYVGPPLKLLRGPAPPDHPSFYAYEIGGSDCKCIEKLNNFKSGAEKRSKRRQSVQSCEMLGA